MRSLLILLLLANVVFFAWQTWGTVTEDAVQTVEPELLPPGVERIILLKEREPGDLQLRNAEQVLAEDAAADREPDAVEELPSDQQADDIAAAIPSEESAQISPVVEDTVVSVPPLCFTLGDFATAAQAQSARQVFAGMGVGVEEQEQIKSILQGYWVYLPPASDYPSARATARQLQDKGIEDLFIMGTGEYRNAISLGLFRQKSAAQSRLAQMRELGFEVKLDEQYRDQTRYRLLLTVPAEPPGLVTQAREQAGQYGALQWQEKPCEELHNAG